MIKNDKCWYAISEFELTQLHFIALLAGGGENISNFVATIKRRLIHIEGEEECFPDPQKEQ